MKEKALGIWLYLFSRLSLFQLSILVSSKEGYHFSSYFAMSVSLFLLLAIKSQVGVEYFEKSFAKVLAKRVKIFIDDKDKPNDTTSWQFSWLYMLNACGSGTNHKQNI